MFNRKMLGERYVTEQVYVHAKVMVVDDRVCDCAVPTPTIAVWSVVATQTPCS
jgi:phosphatidylserine/phosphatidylglycerophosphate/cardiolipin synthase-like enzyme